MWAQNRVEVVCFSNAVLYNLWLRFDEGLMLNGMGSQEMKEGGSEKLLTVVLVASDV